MVTVIASTTLLEIIKPYLAVSVGEHLAISV